MTNVNYLSQHAEGKRTVDFIKPFNSDISSLYKTLTEENLTEVFFEIRKELINAKMINESYEKAQNIAKTINILED